MIFDLKGHIGSIFCLQITFLFIFFVVKNLVCLSIEMPNDIKVLCKKKRSFYLMKFLTYVLVENFILVFLSVQYTIHIQFRIINKHNNRVYILFMFPL